MNKVILVGRLVRDPELRQTTSGASVCRFTVAVDRRFKGQDGERKADFIDCIAWRQGAEFVSRYFSKGRRIGIVGSIQTSTWEDKQGQRQYRTEVSVDETYFVDSKQDGENSGGGGQGYEQTAPTTFTPAAKNESDFLDDNDEMSLPFEL